MVHHQKSLATFTMSGLFLLYSQLICAENLPDAGSLMREQQMQRQLPAQLPVVDKAKTKRADRDSGIQVEVKRFVFTGYDGIAEEQELQKLVSDSLGKRLSMACLDEVLQKVAAYLKDKGWFLSRAYLPDQDVTSGVVEIRIEQGRIDGKVIFRPDKSVRVRPSKLEGFTDRIVMSEEALNMKKLERSLMLINDLPGVKAKASLSPGSKPGTTSLDLRVSEGPLVSGSIWGDNQGNRYTGTWRGNTIILINDPVRVGDQLAMLMTYGGKGLVQGRFSYNVPLGFNGMRGSLSYTGMHYKLVEGAVASSNYSGYSKILDAGLSYPLLRSRSSNVTGTFNFSTKKLVDQLGEVEIRDKNSNSGTFALKGDRYDSLFGGGVTNWNVNLTCGAMHEQVTAAKFDAMANTTEGEFTRMNVGMSRLQHLTDRATMSVAWSSQIAFSNLDSSEKFSLGGPYGIRAYPFSEGSGDHGQLFNGDLRFSLPVPHSWGNVQLGGFYDAGRITIQDTRTMASLGTATNRNTYWLQGAGVSLNYTMSGRLSIRSSWAHVIGDNPGRSTAGNNYDGKSDKSRFWLQSSLSF
jgi:hemolysin activation/secretion protein